MIRPASWPAFSGGSRRTGSISPAPGPPGQLVCESTAAGSYSIKHGGQQEQHARDENRVAGQRDTKDSEHSAGNQEHDPPAGPHGACQPHYLADAGRHIRADPRRPATDVIEHPGPLLRVGSHQTLLGSLLAPCPQDNRGWVPACSRVPTAGATARPRRPPDRGSRPAAPCQQACRAADDRVVVASRPGLPGHFAPRSMPLTRNPSWSRAPLRALGRGLSLLNGNRLRTRLKTPGDQRPRGPPGPRGVVAQFHDAAWWPRASLIAA
jgi:hypothetical protein